MGKPVPKPNAESKPYWDGCNRGELVFQRCTACGRAQFYPRAICVNCYSDKLEWQRSRGRGKIETFTEIHRGMPAAFKDDVPYVVALIVLDEGFRLMSNIVGPRDTIAIDVPVTVEFEQREGQAIPQFRLET